MYLPPLRRRELVGCCALLLTVGCRINFESTDADVATIIDADPVTIVDADRAMIIDAGLIDPADAFVGPDAAPTIASLHLVGSTSCMGPISAITVPAPGLIPGSVALVHAYRRSSNGGVSVSDSRGNAYSELLVSGDNGARMHLWHATITTALIAGDTITLSESNPVASAVIALELRNANPTPFAKVTGAADDTAITVPFGAMAPGLVFCAGANRGGAVQLEASWTELANFEADCGAQGELSAFAQWIPEGKDGITSCEASFSFPTGFEQWVGSVISYVE